MSSSPFAALRLARPALRHLVGPFALVALSLVTGCGGQDATSAADDAAAANDTGSATSGGDVVDGAASDAATPIPFATWYGHIQPIVQRSCLGCHAKGGIAPFALDTPEAVVAMGPVLVPAIASGRMPPWGAQDTALCKPPLPWKHDLRLSAQERATIAAWIADGGKLGDPADAPKSVEIPPDKLGRVDRSLTAKTPFVTSGTKDQFICFVLDPELVEDVWIRGVHFRAGNAKVAHHALLFVDEAGKSVALGGADGRYPCFGGPKIDGRLIAAWAPGGVPAEMPASAGLPIAKGSKLVIQMHYHPIGSEQPDATTVELEFTDGRPQWTALSMLIGNFPGAIGGGDGLLPGPNDDGKVKFEIPAGATDHSETMVWTLPKFQGASIGGLRLFGVATHMHYVGRDMRIWVEPGQKPGLCDDTVRANLGACLDTACGGKVGSDLVTCAVIGCSKQVNAAPVACQQCMVAASGAGAKPMWDVCAPTADAPGTPEVCLLHTPAWDFNWQRYYFFDAPVEQLPSFGTGDRLWMRCGYDNSKSNPGVVQALLGQGKDAPATVRLGEETLDEMCLAALYLLIPTAPKQ